MVTFFLVEIVLINGRDRSMKDHQGRVNWRWKGEEREKEVVYAKRRAVYPVFEAKVLRAT